MMPKSCFKASMNAFMGLFVTNPKLHLGIDVREGFGSCKSRNVSLSMNSDRLWEIKKEKIG